MFKKKIATLTGIKIRIQTKTVVNVIKENLPIGVLEIKKHAPMTT